MQNKRKDKLMPLAEIIKELRSRGYKVNSTFRKKIFSMAKSGDINVYDSRDVLVAHNKHTGGDTDIFTHSDGHNWLNAPLYRMSDIVAILDKKA